MSIFPPVYLHYLDRELLRSVDTAVYPRSIIDVTKLLLIATNVRFYSVLSHVWESSEDFGEALHFLVDLAKYGHLDFPSTQPTLAEFIEVRQQIYTFDKDRYPMYFTDNVGIVSNFKPTIYKVSSTTSFLDSDLQKWVDPQSNEKSDRITVYQPGALLELRPAVRKTLLSREDEAVTHALFRREMNKILNGRAVISGLIRRRISESFTRHYTNFLGADIPTGIRGLDYFDRISGAFPIYDVPLLNEIFYYTGLYQIYIKNTRNVWESFLSVRGSRAHYDFVRSLRRFILTCVFKSDLTLPLTPSPANRAKIAAKVRHYLADDANQNYREIPAFEMLRLAQDQLLSIVNKKLFIDPQTMMEMGMPESVVRPIVLLVTATTRETRALFKAFEEETRNQMQRIFLGDHTYHDLGVVGGCRVMNVQTEMGSGGPSGSTLTVFKAAQDLAPKAVILVGIAFGLNPDKQKLGQILISRQVMGYEKQRVGVDEASGTPKIIPRGDRVQCSVRLLDRFRSGTLNWSKSKVKFGLILSGEKLVDEPGFNTQLREIESEAIGGEMEGAGLYAAASRLGIDWIVIKAICDWGDGKKKNSYQERAATNAAELVLHVIKQGGIC